MARETSQSKNTEVVGPTCDGPICPLCTKTGLMLVGMGLILLLTQQTILHFIGVILVISAYILPIVNRKQKPKK
ncbi:MAG: hypothetical protein ABH950_04155 [Candidatus Altiarchaeota archaeon]